MEGTVTISKNEYFELRMDGERLSRLDCGGVDNWDNYEDAINDCEQSLDEFESELRKEIEAR